MPKSTMNYMIFSNKAFFYLTFPPNNQNNFRWVESNHCLGVETSLHDQNNLVMCAISANQLYGSYYLEDNLNQRLNATNYMNMLKTFFWPKLLENFFLGQSIEKTINTRCSSSSYIYNVSIMVEGKFDNNPKWIRIGSMQAHPT